PNCMVIASDNIELTRLLVKQLTSPLIRFYYGRDLLGTEIGAAAKNVMGIAAGMLDGLGYGSPRPTAAPKDKIIDDYKQPQTYAGFRIGQNVRHAKFGTGVIIDAVDKGESARLTINFGKQGVKELDTKFAKLEEM
ncbi:MAG: DNA helicase II, partial [Neisseria elongata]